jgi:hypothetical protein
MKSINTIVLVLRDVVCFLIHGEGAILNTIGVATNDGPEVGVTDGKCLIVCLRNLQYSLPARSMNGRLTRLS